VHSCSVYWEKAGDRGCIHEEEKIIYDSISLYNEFNDNKQKECHPQPLSRNDRIQQSQPFLPNYKIGDHKFQLTIIKEMLNKINDSFISNDVKINTLI